MTAADESLFRGMTAADIRVIVIVMTVADIHKVSADK